MWIISEGFQSGLPVRFIQEDTALHLVETEITRIEVILSNKPLSKRCPLICGIHAFFKLSEELAHFAGELLRTNDGNPYTLIGKRLRVVWSVLIDLLVYRPWNSY